MPDALKVDLVLTGVEKTLKDLQRVGQEMKGLNGSGGRVSGTRSVRNDEARQDQQQRRELDKLAKIRQDRQLREERQMAKQRKQMQADANKVGNGAEGIELGEAAETLAMLEEFAGPIAALLAGFKALGAAAQSASEDIHHFRDAQNIGGGTANETSQGAAIGRQFGISGEDFANDARQFNEKIATDPWAGSYAARHGIRSQPEPFGDADKMTNLLKELDHLRTIKSDTDARREAYATGTEKYLGVRDISDSQWNMKKVIAGINAQGMTPDETRADANRRAAQQNLEDLGASLWNNLGRTVTKDIDKIIGAFMPKSIREAHDKNLYGGGQSDTRATTAMEQHTAAMQAHTLAMQNYGIYGGGDRTHGAVPGAYLPSGVRKPEWAEKQIRANAAALGAFAL